MYDAKIDKHPKIGDVFMVMFDGVNSEQQGWRPAVVFQNNVGNTYSPNVIVLPMTSKVKKTNQPTHVIIPGGSTGLKRTSMVLCENPCCISKDKLGPYITTLSNVYLGRIAIAHILASSAIAFVDIDAIASIRQKAYELNKSSLDCQSEFTEVRYCV